MQALATGRPEAKKEAAAAQTAIGFSRFRCGGMPGLRRCAVSLAVTLLIANSGLCGACTIARAQPATAVRFAVVPGSVAGKAADATDTQQYAISTRVDRIGRIIAPVTIDGRGPFRFMLDTGATRTVLAEATLAKLDRIADSCVCVPISGVTGSELAAAVHIDTLDAGDLHFRNLSLPVLTGPVLDGIDGILGMDGFDGMKLSADFIKDRITISRSRAERPGAKYSVIPVEFVFERLLMVEVTVGGVHAKAVIDTGGPRTIGNEALLTALLTGRQRIAQSIETRVVDATQVSQAGMMGRVPALRLGGTTTDNLDVTFGDFAIFSNWGLQNEPALLLGMDVLGTLSNLSIDYKRKEVALQPRPLERPVSQTRWHSLTYR